MPADNVIIAEGAIDDTSLADTLVAADIHVRAMGDAGKSAIYRLYIEGAIRGAADAMRYPRL